MLAANRRVIPHERSVSASESRVKAGILIVGNLSSVWNGNVSVSEDICEQFNSQGIPTVATSPVKFPLLRLADMMYTTWTKRNDYRIALVSVFSGRAFFWAESVCWLLRINSKPYVLALHGGNLPVFAKRWPQRVQKLLKSAAAVTVPSPYLASEMRNYRNDFTLLRNPIDLSDYDFTLRRKARAKLIWLRAFHELYNPALAVRVVAKLVEEFPEVQLIMIGPDKGDGSLARTRCIAVELGVSQHITFVGRVDNSQVADWLSKCDIFLNTTNVDNTPVSVVEAMASGLCVVSTNVGGIPFLLEDGTNALLSPANNEEAMASAAARLLRESDLAGRLSALGRTTAMAFSWEESMPKYERLIETVLSSAHPVV